MKLAPRFAVLLAAAAVVAGCAPQTSDNSSSDKDDQSGTLRVWLFQEVGNDPKAKVVDSVVAAFEKAHKGTKVDVEYIPIDTRAQRVKAAFNDPKSAPDVMEYGNTDTAGYVHDGGLLDVTKDFGAWSEAKDTDPTAKQSVTVDGRMYGSPFYVGVRALYYRTDVFKDLGLQPPSPWPSWPPPPGRSTRRSPTSTALSSAARTRTGRCRSCGPTGVNSPRPRGIGGSYTSAIDSAAAQKGIKAYTSLFSSDNCPAAKCAVMGGNDTITAFAAGKAGMAIGGDFSHTAVEAGKVKGKYAVVPLPGVASGSVAPAFAGGNNIGVLKSTSHRTLAVDLMEQLTSKATQTSMFDAMGFLPTFTDVRDAAAAKVPFEKPFVQTLAAGTKFVPASPGWSEIDSSLVLPTMLQEVISGKKDVAAASKDAAKKMNAAFSSAG